MQDIPVLGKLETFEVYEFYDEPLLYACKDKEGQIYLVVASIENDAFEDWIYAKVSDERFASIRQGDIDVHDSFAKTESGTVFIVRYPKDPDDDVFTTETECSEVSKDWLPLAGELLTGEPWPEEFNF